MKFVLIFALFSLQMKMTSTRVVFRNTSYSLNTIAMLFALFLWLCRQSETIKLNKFNKNLPVNWNRWICLPAFVHIHSHTHTQVAGRINCHQYYVRPRSTLIIFYCYLNTRKMHRVAICWPEESTLKPISITAMHWRVNEEDSSLSLKRDCVTNILSNYFHFITGIVCGYSSVPVFRDREHGKYFGVFSMKNTWIDCRNKNDEQTNMNKSENIPLVI